jgi:hypothetical protein
MHSNPRKLVHGAKLIIEITTLGGRGGGGEKEKLSSQCATNRRTFHELKR